MKFDKEKLTKNLYQIKNTFTKLPYAMKETIKDKKMWAEWLGALGVYLVPWNVGERVFGYQFRNNIHELEEWVNFGITVPLYFPLSSPLRKFLENLRGKELDYKHQYLLEIGSAFAWKGIQTLGRLGILPIFQGLWEGEETNYPSLVFDNIEKIFNISIKSESVRDLIRTITLGSASSYLKKKLSEVKKIIHFDFQKNKINKANRTRNENAIAQTENPGNTT